MSEDQINPEQAMEPEEKTQISQTVTEQPEITSSEPSRKKTCFGHKGIFILNGILLIGLVVLYVLFFMQKTQVSKPTVVPATVPQTGDIKYAYINTDTLFTNYAMAINMRSELDAFQKNLETSYRNKIEKLQTDYQEYLKIGATLTLTEQKKREESLNKRQMELAQLEGSLMGQVQEKQFKENTKLLNAVYAFIKDYNQKNQQFNIIFKKSFADGPVLFIEETHDITNEILEGLNKEYEEVNKK